MLPIGFRDVWMSRPVANPHARIRLFCFPYAGGGASLYRTWSEGLPVEVEVCLVHLPGRESRLAEQPFTRLPALIDVLGAAIQPYRDLPTAFFGYSMGALIGFELARYLRRENGQVPEWLFLAAHRAPHLPDPNPELHYLSEEAFIEELRQLGGTPPSILDNVELIRLLLPMLRADFALCEAYTYSPEQPLTCPISVFGGLDDDRVSREDLMTWREQTRGPFLLRMFPGDHFFLHTAGDLLLQAVSRDIRILLAQGAKQ